MSRLSYVETVLDELASEIGLKNMPLDSTGRVSVRFETVPITLAYSDQPVELLWLYADLGSLPEEGYEAPAFLLQLGFALWASNRMTVGLDEKGEVALGYTVIPVSALTFPLLRDVFKQLAETAKPIRERLERGDYTIDVPTPPVEGGSPHHHFQRV